MWEMAAPLRPGGDDGDSESDGAAEFILPRGRDQHSLGQPGTSGRPAHGYLPGRRRRGSAHEPCVSVPTAGGVCRE